MLNVHGFRIDRTIVKSTREAVIVEAARTTMHLGGCFVRKHGQLIPEKIVLYARNEKGMEIVDSTSRMREYVGGPLEFVWKYYLRWGGQTATQLRKRIARMGFEPSCIDQMFPQKRNRLRGKSLLAAAKRMYIFRAGRTTRVVVPMAETILYLGVWNGPKNRVKRLVLFTNARGRCERIDTLMFCPSYPKQFWWYWFQFRHGTIGIDRDKVKVRLSNLGFDPGLLDRVCVDRTNRRRN